MHVDIRIMSVGQDFCMLLLTRLHRAGFFGLFRGRYLQPLTIGLSLMLFQQITGQPSVLYYAADIFSKAGFGSSKDATGVSVLLGFFKLVMTGAHSPPLSLASVYMF
jgi:hypothetical protein